MQSICVTCGQIVQTNNDRVTEKIRTSMDIANRSEIVALKTARREHVLVYHLDARNNIILSLETVSIGTSTESLVAPREVFRQAILAGANAIIMVHNHPSGESEPSEADIRITKRLSEAGAIIGISLYDHIIVGSRGDYSMHANGFI
jgi:DNA repair protein RadC